MVAAVNRLAVDPEPPLPRDPQARRDHLSDAVMKAVSAAARLLDDDDSAVVLKAVKEILDLEKTRMRHGQNVLGAHPPYLDDLAKELGSVHSGGPPRLLVDDIYDDDDDNVLAAAAKDHGAQPFPTFTPNREGPRERQRPAETVAVETVPDGTEAGEDTDDFQTWMKKCLAQRRLAAAAPAAPVVPPLVPVEVPRDRDTFHLAL